MKYRMDSKNVSMKYFTGRCSVGPTETHTAYFICTNAGDKA